VLSLSQAHALPESWAQQIDHAFAHRVAVCPPPIVQMQVKFVSEQE
jgi:hypothetical protein